MFRCFDPSLSVRDDIHRCNYIDVKSASAATRLLLAVSIEIDREINTRTDEFYLDMITLEE